jgi:hypothetical protein
MLTVMIYYWTYPKGQRCPPGSKYSRPPSKTKVAHNATKPMQSNHLLYSLATAPPFSSPLSTALWPLLDLTTFFRKFLSPLSVFVLHLETLHFNSPDSPLP